MNNKSKQFNQVLLAAIFTTTAVLSISQANAFERGAHRGADRGAGSFSRIDVDQDGQLSLAELTTPAMSKIEKKLSRKDNDEDGLISFEEFQQSRNGTLTDLSDIADDIVQCVADVKAETDNDDILVPSADKFMSPTDKFAAIDTSGDGYLSLEELQAKITTHVAATFLVMDQDANGFVSKDEFNLANAKRRATKAATRQCIDELTSDDII